MSSVLQVRNVPDDVRRGLEARASANGESLNSYLLRLLSREAARLTAREVLARAAQRGETADVSVVDILDAARRER